MLHSTILKILYIVIVNCTVLYNIVLSSALYSKGLNCRCQVTPGPAGACRSGSAAVHLPTALEPPGPPAGARHTYFHRDRLRLPA